MGSIFSSIDILPIEHRYRAITRRRSSLLGHTAIATALVLIFGGANKAAVAQETAVGPREGGDETDLQTDEITVYGYKREEATTGRLPLSIKDTPSSVSVVTEDWILETASTTRAQALEQISGVSRDVAVDGEAAINIRGFDLEDQVRFNGVTLFDGIPFDPALIERIEVPKGPSSIVAGASSPGGVLSIFTKQPQAENFASLTQEFGSFGRLRTVADLNGVLPENDGVRARVVAVYLPDTGTFLDNTDADEFNVAPSFEFDTFGGAGELRVSAQYQSRDGVNSRGVPLLASTGDAPDIDPTTNVGGGSANGAFSESERVGVQAEYEHEFVEDLTLNVRGGFAYGDRDNLDVYAFNFAGIPDTGDIAIYGSRTTNETSIWSGEVTLAKKFDLFGQTHDVVIGTDYRNEDVENFLAFSFPPVLDNIFDLQNTFDGANATFPFEFVDTESDFEQNGMFGQAVLRPADGVILTFGARHDWARVDILNLLSAETTNVDQNDFTFRVGGSYAVNQWANVYATYQQSFLPQTALEVSGDIVPPETGENVEVGAKFDLFDGRFSVTTALFRTQRQNVATADPNNPGFSIVTGEQRNQGVEFDINGEPIPGLKLNAQFSYLDAEITADTNEAVIGNSPAFIPVDYRAGFFGTYQFQQGALDGFGFGGGGFFHSGFIADLSNSFQTDAYERYDVVMFYEPSDWLRLSFNARNLADAVYIESPGGPTSLNQFGPPRTFFGSVRVQF